MKLPFVDGQRFVDSKLREQVVDGSILANGGVHVLREEDKVYNHDICWTIRDDWFRRVDGKEMTGAGGEPMTIDDYYQWRKHNLRP